MLSRTIYIILIVINITHLKAQEIGAKVDFLGYADNREYKAKYTTPKTYFGTLISPQVYLTIEQKHNLIAGVHYNQDFGRNNDNYSKQNAIAYYNYNNEVINFSIGLIPRIDKLYEMPKLVLADTFMYDRPNIEGMKFYYNKNNKRQQIFIDWISKQSQTKKEQFIVGTSGYYQWKNICFKNDALLYHNALTCNDSINENVQDNFVLTGSLGVDLSKKTLLDSLTIDAGIVFGYDRLRTHYENRGYGFITNFHLIYKDFILNNTFYIGDPLNLPNGDPFYRRKQYNRLDLGWIPFKTKNIEAHFFASFHFREGGMDNQQVFTLKYKFDKVFWKNN